MGTRRKRAPRAAGRPSGQGTAPGVCRAPRRRPPRDAGVGDEVTVTFVRLSRTSFETIAAKLRAMPDVTSVDVAES